MLEKSKDQLTWYNSGIGTYARPSWKSPAYWRMVIHNYIDLAIAWYVFSYLSMYSMAHSPSFLSLREFDRTVMGAYHWLSENYQEGDRIFLFGMLFRS